MESALFQAAFALYAFSTFLALAYLYSKNQTLTLWMWRLLGVALCAHLASFILRTQIFWQTPENRYFLPIHTFFGALSWLALANALVFWMVEGLSRLHILGAFVLPWTLLASAIALLCASREIRDLPPVLQSYWINFHPLILMLSYTTFANAFGVGLALLIQERQIKSRKPRELCYRLPAIEELERLHYRIITASMPVLTVGILLGILWAYRAWGRFWDWDPKETWAAITWIIYAAYLGMHRWGEHGRRSIYVSMMGFVSVIFTFFAVNYLSELHDYLSP